MSGDAAFWVLFAGLGAAMAILLMCRAHWFALLDAMYRTGAAMQARLGWPTEHPFNMPGDDGAPVARKFPVRRVRARVMLRGLPRPDLCPPAARRHARAFRVWGALLIAELVAVAAVMVSPWAVAVAAGLLALRLVVVPRWPTTGDAGAEAP